MRMQYEHPTLSAQLAQFDDGVDQYIDVYTYFHAFPMPG